MSVQGLTTRVSFGTETGDAGEFVIPGVPSGEYAIHVSAPLELVPPGFKSATVTVQVAGASTTSSVVLEPGISDAPTRDTSRGDEPDSGCAGSSSGIGFGSPLDALAAGLGDLLLSVLLMAGLLWARRRRGGLKAS